MHHPMKDCYPKRKRGESPQRGRDKDFRASEPRVQPAPKPVDPPAQDGMPASASDPFKPLTKELGVLEDKDPVLAAQAARLVALYRRMWDAYVAKHADSQRLEKENCQLESRNTSLEKEKRKIEDRYEEQRDLLARFQKTLENVQDGITKIWDSRKNTPAVLPETRDDDRPVVKEDSQADATSVTPAANQETCGLVAAPAVPIA